jgi:hypothetical protein
VVVPTWTLLAALTAGLILGVLGSRLFNRPSPLPAPAVQTVTEETAAQEPAAQEAAPPVAASQETVAQEAAAPVAASQETVAQEAPAQVDVAAEPQTEPAPAPPAPPPAAAEPIRISMEDVVSELERRYQGRQADTSSEKRPSGRRKRTR